MNGQQQEARQSQGAPFVQGRPPRAKVNIRDWTKRLGEEIRLVSERTSCTQRVAHFYQRDNVAQFQRIDAAKLRDSILVQINSLLSQHRAALNAIVSEAEQAAAQHKFQKELKVNYTDVHRLRNELESQQAQIEQELAMLAQQPTMTSGQALTSSQSQSTSISGGTPVPGPPEWQTPIKSLAMQVVSNFGEIAVNTSQSAVHLPLPIYAGLPEIMNGIGWSESLDRVFRRNLDQYAHVYHQLYGDHLGFLRTFPAHKWRIPRTEPDLFDARMRPWYIAGASQPKDMVILVDSSGSMTGLRREIAKGVVYELLDTLTINDYFAVLRFAETVTPVGFPKCSNLRQPSLSVKLEAECPSAGYPGHYYAPGGPLLAAAAGGGHGGPGAAALLQLSRQYAAAGHDGSPVAPGGLGAAPSPVECANFRRQWDARGQYLRDHPEVIVGKNGSYISDEAYRRSIWNVTNDIRDAYLLPATSRNIRYLKSNFSMPTAGIANFTHALMAAFELLHSYNRTHDSGSQCQQTIVVITDGAIRAHQEVFNRYNYPGSPVRVFTYMIGREVGDIGPTKEMACSNRGYYAHVINLSEAREQVQKYLPVMARPLVLAQQHPVSWTNAYGDETYQVLSDWVLELKRRERARIMLNEEREKLNEANSNDVINIELTNIPEYDELPLVDEQFKNRIICEDPQSTDPKMIQSLEDEMDPLGYNETACHWTTRRADLLISVAKPVFDLRNTSVIFERVLSKNVWTERETRVRNAQLLGVAAVDLRVADIMRSVPSHMLGPNAYAILLGHNGFVLHHPDHRALLEDPFDRQSKILKPHFNVVDLTHIEQVHQRNESTTSGATSGQQVGESVAAGQTMRRRNEEVRLLKLREAAIRKATGQETIGVKRAVDCRRRPHVRQQSFYYGPIKDTPFALMLAFPKSYGLNRVQAKLALTKSTQMHFSPTEYELLTVHPDYRYCERQGASTAAKQQQQQQQQSQQQQQPQEPQPSQSSSLNTLLSLFKLAADEEAQQPAERLVELADLNAISEQTAGRKRQKQPPTAAGQTERFLCDKELFPSLLFDARATYEPAGGSGLCCEHAPAASSMFFQSGRRTSSDDSSPPTCDSSPEDMRSKLAQIYGLEMSFVATRSGLTRARLFELSPRTKKLATLFIERHSKAVEEPWYARTVDWNLRSAENARSTLISVPYNAYVRLIAKLRQRITQRHPAVNDTRSNCDPSLDESADYEQGPSGSADEQQGQAAGSSEAPLGGSSDASQSTSSPVPVPKVRAARSPADELEQPPPPETSTGAPATPGEPAATETPAKLDYSQYSSFEFLELLANSSVHVAATQSIVVQHNHAGGPTLERTPVGVTGHLYDYATFARRFLNSTSLRIRTLEPEAEADADGEPEESSSLPAGGSSKVPKVHICPNGQCPTKCGLRSDTIDCLLVDNNGYIVVGEELAHVGRPLADYDEKLMASLVERRLFQQIVLTDYQAICARNDQAEVAAAAAARQAATSGPPAGQSGAQTTSSSSGILMVAAATTSPGSSAAMSQSLSSSSGGGLASLEASVGRALANFAAALIYTGSAIWSALLLGSAGTLPDGLLRSGDSQSWLGQLQHWHRSSLLAAEAQSATANQSLLALLPNKTYLRPCEKQIVLYELRPSNQEGPNHSGAHPADVPHLYETKCGCSGWYVYDYVPETNLIMLIVNTSTPCRRCNPALSQTLAPVFTPLIDTSLLAGTPAQRASQQASKLQEASLAAARGAAEDQVCTMLEQDAQLFTSRPQLCLPSHPEEAQIHLCGGAHGGPSISSWLTGSFALISLLSLLLMSSQHTTVEHRLRKGMSTVPESSVGCT